jgi:hypothetical protein
MRDAAARMFIGYFCVVSGYANRPIGRLKTVGTDFFDSGQPARTPALLGYSEETLEDFV